MFSSQAIFTAIALISSVCSRDEIDGQKFYKTEMGLTQVPSDIPPEMGEVHLNGNSITSVNENAFSSLTSCTLLNLGYNSIPSIDSGAFNGLGNLNSLNLEHNRMKVLEEGMFDGMPLLRVLNLANNVITDIQSGSFRNLGNLEVLFLTSNHLATIDGDMWIGLNSLNYIHLQFNSRLQTLPPGAISNMPRLHVLSLHNDAIKTLDINMFNAADYPDSDGHPPTLRLTIKGNPLVCDTKLCWLKRAEEEGWLSFDTGFGPDCAYNVVWDNLKLDCSTEAPTCPEVSQSTCQSYCEQQCGANDDDEKDGNETLTLALVAVGCLIGGIVLATCVILLYIRRYGAKLCCKESTSAQKIGHVNEAGAVNVNQVNAPPAYDPLNPQNDRNSGDGYQSIYMYPNNPTS